MTPSTSCRDLVAELGAHVLDVGLGVLDDVVEERGRDRLLVEPELGADACGADGMLDEVGARLALLARRAPPRRTGTRA